jgi:hypothetical protein
VPRGAAQSARACEACGWRFERCAGHWVGGNEVNLLAAFTVGVAAWAVSAAFLGLTPAAAWIGTAATGVFSVASYRRSRCVFFALDYLLDPEPDPTVAAARDDGPDAAGGDRDPRRDWPDSPPRPPAPGGPAARARVPATVTASASAGSSESLIAPPPAPYPPPATVSP